MPELTVGSYLYLRTRRSATDWMKDLDRTTLFTPVEKSSYPYVFTKYTQLNSLAHQCITSTMPPASYIQYIHPRGQLHESEGNYNPPDSSPRSSKSAMCMHMYVHTQRAWRWRKIARITRASDIPSPTMNRNRGSRGIWMISKLMHNDNLLIHSGSLPSSLSPTFLSSLLSLGGDSYNWDR